jgi:hypothetical protein
MEGVGNRRSRRAFHFSHPITRVDDRLTELRFGDLHRVVFHGDFASGNAEALNTFQAAQRSIERLLVGGRVEPIDGDLCVDVLVREWNPELERRTVPLGLL